VTGITYDEGSYLASLDLAEQRVTAGGWPAERDRLRDGGLLAGIGYSCFSERTAYGTPVMSQRRMRMTPGYDTAHVRMDPSGEVIVTTGTCGHGQGHEGGAGIGPPGGPAGGERLPSDVAEDGVRMTNCHERSQLPL